MWIEYAVFILAMLISYDTIAYALLYAWYSKRIGAPFSMLPDSKFWQQAAKRGAAAIAVALTALTVLFRWSSI